MNESPGIRLAFPGSQIQTQTTLYGGFAIGGFSKWGDGFFIQKGRGQTRLGKYRKRVIDRERLSDREREIESERERELANKE